MLLNKDINSFWEDKILQMIPKLYSATMFRSCELIMQKIKSQKKKSFMSKNIKTYKLKTIL